MGTPDFAVASLKILVENEYDVVAVVTATDKYGGRGGKRLIESAVKKYAQSQNIDILQPPNLKNPEFVERLRSYEADLQIIVAFRMLPEVVWNMPKSGTYNLHGSLLPKYRGAAPIHWAVINGDKQTGVTSFKLKHAIDTGDLALQKRMPIYSDDTTGTVHDRMMHIGAQTILETVELIAQDRIELHPQDDSLKCPAPKLNQENSKINFDQSCKTVYDFIRGMNPFPSAWTELHGKKLKVYACNYSFQGPQENPGQIYSDRKTYIQIICADGHINLQDVQLAGKKRMLVSDFLNGYNWPDSLH